MNIFRNALLWPVALFLACFIFYRIRRNKAFRLEGEFSPRLVHMIALLLVFLYACTDRLSLKLPENPSSQPKTLNQPTSQTLSLVDFPAVPLEESFPQKLFLELRTNFELQPPHGYWKHTKQLLAQIDREDFSWKSVQESVQYFAKELEGKSASLFTKPSTETNDALSAFEKKLLLHFQKRENNEVSTISELIELIDLAESIPLYDTWFAAYLWQQGQNTFLANYPSLNDMATLFARLEMHFRVVHTLVKAQAETGPVEFVAWRSKAAPTKGWGSLRIPENLAKVSKDLFSKTDAGTWNTEVLTQFDLLLPTPSLVHYRRGEASILPSSGPVTLGRLDLFYTNDTTILEHSLLGKLTIPSKRIVSLYNLDSFLSEESKGKLSKWAEAANQGDQSAYQQIEKTLPFASKFLQDEVKKNPDAPGAPGLRMLLSLLYE